MTNPDLLGDRREPPVPGPDRDPADAVPELPQAAALAPGPGPGQASAEYRMPPMPAPQVPPAEAVAKRRWYLRAWFIVPATPVIRPRVLPLLRPYSWALPVRIAGVLRCPGSHHDPTPAPRTTGAKVRPECREETR
jgi:hypothetical protein